MYTKYVWLCLLLLLLLLLLLYSLIGNKSEKSTNRSLRCFCNVSHWLTIHLSCRI